MDSHQKHNKPTAPPPPCLESPPDYNSATCQKTAIHTLVEAVKGGAQADTLVTKSVNTHVDTGNGQTEVDEDGWTRMKTDRDSDSGENEDAEDGGQFIKPTAIVNPTSDKKYVRITIKIPGLKVRFLTHGVLNGRVLSQEYKKNKVMLTFELNENESDKKVYKYESRGPLAMNIQEEGSYIKYDKDTLKWRIKKA